MRCSTPEQAAAAVRPAFPKRLLKRQECFVVLALDAVNAPIGRPRIVAMGTVNGVEVHPRDIFRVAIARNAVSIIVAHNHPSGDTEPSLDDRALTRKISEAGKLLGIPLLDHIIVTPSGKYTSLATIGII